eukprot:2583710-Pleurochrysis_carterae.AAC.1
MAKAFVGRAHAILNELGYHYHVDLKTNKYKSYLRCRSWKAPILTAPPPAQLASTNFSISPEHESTVFEVFGTLHCFVIFGVAPDPCRQYRLALVRPVEPTAD